MYSMYMVEAYGTVRRAVYGVCLCLSLYYWLDTAVLAVNDPLFPELEPDRKSYRWSVAGRIMQFASMVICIAIYTERFVIPSGAIRLLELLMWMLASLGQHVRASQAQEPIEFSRFLTGWGALAKMSAATFSGLGFELTAIFCLFDTLAQNYVQYFYDPAHLRLASLQFSLVNSALAIAGSFLLEKAARETFLLRLRLYTQLVRGANAALSQHGMLDGSPAAVALVGAGYATVRPNAPKQADSKETCTKRYLRIDLHRNPTVVVSTTGLQRILDGLQEAFQKHGLDWMNFVRGGRDAMPQDDIVSSRIGHFSSQAPMLEHTGKDLVRMLGVCKQDRPLAYWALFCAPNRQDDDFRAAALRASLSLEEHSVSLLKGIKNHGAFTGLRTVQVDRREQHTGPQRLASSDPSQDLVTASNGGLGNLSPASKGGAQLRVSEYVRGGGVSGEDEDTALQSIKLAADGRAAQLNSPAGSSNDTQRSHVTAKELTLLGRVVAMSSAHPPTSVHAHSQRPNSVNTQSTGATDHPAAGSVDASSSAHTMPGDPSFLTHLGGPHVQDHANGLLVASEPWVESSYQSIDVAVQDWTGTTLRQRSGPGRTRTEAQQPREFEESRTAGTGSNVTMSSLLCDWAACCLRTFVVCDVVFGCGPCLYCCQCFRQVIEGDLPGEHSDAILQLADQLTELFYVSRTAAYYGASLELEPLEQIRSAVEPWQELDRMRLAVARRGSGEPHSYGLSSPAVETPSDNQIRSVYDDPGVVNAVAAPPEEPVPALRRYGSRRKPKPRTQHIPGAAYMVKSDGLQGTKSSQSVDAAAFGIEMGISPVTGQSQARSTHASQQPTSSTTGQVYEERQPDAAAPGEFPERIPHSGYVSTDRSATGPPLSPLSSSKVQARQAHGRLRRARVFPSQSDASIKTTSQDIHLQSKPGRLRGGGTLAKEVREDAEPVELGATYRNFEGHQGLAAASGHDPAGSLRLGGLGGHAGHVPPATTVASRIRLVHPSRWQGLPSSAGLLGATEQQQLRQPQVQGKGGASAPKAGADDDTSDASFAESGMQPDRGASEAGQLTQVQEMVEVRRRFRGLLSRLQGQGQGQGLRHIKHTGSSIAVGTGDTSKSARKMHAAVGGEEVPRPLRQPGYQQEEQQDDLAELGDDYVHDLSRSLQRSSSRRSDSGWPILRSTPDERHVVLRVGLGNTVVAEVCLMARRHEGGAVVSLTLMSN